MAATCCGGEWDLFLQKYRHKKGCPKNQVAGNRQRAQQSLDRGRKDAFKPSTSTDPSHRLGKTLAEQERIEHVVNNVFGFPVGGRRRRR